MQEEWENLCIGVLHKHVVLGCIKNKINIGFSHLRTCETSNLIMIQSSYHVVFRHEGFILSKQIIIEPIWDHYLTNTWVYLNRRHIFLLLRPVHCSDHVHIIDLCICHACWYELKSHFMPIVHVHVPLILFQKDRHILMRIKTERRAKFLW